MQAYQTVAAIVLAAAMLTACGSQPVTQNTPAAPPANTENQQTSTPAPSPYTYIDSTELFAGNTASVSLRASFATDNSAMAKGYQFQFRTLSKTPVFLSSISVVAGGQRLFIEEGQIVLPAEKGISLSLPLADSQFIAGYDSALLQFRYNNESFLMQIELHRLSAFLP